MVEIDQLIRTIRSMFSHMNQCKNL